MVVNVQHIKAIPGRKKDVKDAEWIAKLIRHSLVMLSFIPDRVLWELRKIVRYRQSIYEEKIRKRTDSKRSKGGCSIKLSSVASDVMGFLGRPVLEAMNLAKQIQLFPWNLPASHSGTKLQNSSDPCKELLNDTY